MADAFRVLHQRQSSALSPGGGFQQVMIITAETVPGGQPFSEEVPLRMYSDPAYVHDRLDARAREIAAVQAL